MAYRHHNPPKFIGSGAFANVYEVVRTSDNHICAAKILNKEKLQSQYPQEQQQKILCMFVQECRIIKELSHLNLVQYMDITYEENLPVLLMEMMHTTLARYLHVDGNIHELIPFPIQVSICHDIAQALSFLHRNSVIHRDLSSNNVLLTEVTNSEIPIAKVGDLGMAKLRQSIILNCPQTTCPGTKNYMPPEAMDSPAIYGTELDVFSFGVLMIEIMTRKCPNPTPRFQEVNHMGSFTPVLELQRRRDHITSIPQEHPLLSIAIQCIQNAKGDRPSADHLASEIMRRAIAIIHQQVLDKNAIIQQLTGAPFQLKQQPTNLKAAPTVLKRSADAVIDDDIGNGKCRVYLRVGNEKKLYSFIPADDSWKECQDCINYQSSLAVINHVPLAIGGIPELGDKVPHKQEVYKLLNESWDLETRMLTPRGRTTALTCVYDNNKVLIVTGGETLDSTSGKVKSLKVVEVYDGESWRTASEVPVTHSSSSGTIVHNDVFLHGGWTKRGHEMLTVCTCSLEDLINSCKMSPKPQVWSQITPTFPIARTTSTMFCDHLLIAGGIMNIRAKTAVSEIRIYNRYTRQWKTVGHLPQALSLCFVVALPDNTLLVIGGQPDTSTSTKDVQIFELQ